MSLGKLRVLFIIFTSIYIGVSHHLFQIHASDYSKFLPPFFNDFLNAVAAPLMILLIPAFILFVIYLVLNKLNKKLPAYFISIIISTSLVLYIMRAYYLVEGGYILSLIVLLLILVLVFIIVLILIRFFFNLFLGHNLILNNNS